MEQSAYLMLIRFGSPRRVAAFSRGELYFAPISHFRKIDDGGLRGDRNEALAGLYQADRAYLEIETEEGVMRIDEASGLKGPIIARHLSPEYTHLLCLHSIIFPCTDWKIDGRNANFGERAFIIPKSKQFLSKLSDKLSELGYPFKMAPIEYIDPNSHHGPLDIFHKFSSYSYQREYRVAIAADSAAGILIDLGDISDLGHMVDSHRINTFLSGESD